MISKEKCAPNGPLLSEFIQGYWRLASWNMSIEERIAFINQHLELGISSVDHADIYGDYRCEALFGEALHRSPSLRSQLEIITKCDIKLCSEHYPSRKINHYDTSFEHITSSVEASLRNLQTDYIDMLLIHRPDALMDANEVAHAFSSLKDQGKVLHFGVSNFTPSQFSLLQSRLDFQLVTNQVEINPMNFGVVDDGTLDLLQQLRIRPMAWSCLAGGELFNGQTEQAVRLRAELLAIAQEVGAESVDQVIYAWVRQLPSKPLAIMGSGKIERVRSALASQKIQLTREQWYRIWAASKGHGVP